MSDIQIDWSSVVERKPQGYCEIQDQENGLVFHGPVQDIVIDENDMVMITLKWVAQMGLPGKPNFGKWKKAPDEYKLITFPNLMAPFKIQKTGEKGDRVIFGGCQLLYFDKQRGIDSTKVEGLDLRDLED